MIFTTLGTSHGDHTHSRYNTATLVEIQGQSYLIDCGEPASGTMIRAGKDLDKLRAVMLTHMHGDHAGGVPNLLRRVVKYPRATAPLTLYLPESDAGAGLDHWLQAQHVAWPSPQVEMGVVRPGMVFEHEELRVTAIPTRHMEHLSCPSFAYLLEGEGKRVVLTGDLRGDFTDFPQTVREQPCDLCFCEATHYSLPEAVPILAACPVGRLVFYHVSNAWHGAEGEARLKQICAPLPFPYHIAHDGDVFEP
jgi:ribonuclease BN (tRNA processing enzyme)